MIEIKKLYNRRVGTLFLEKKQRKMKDSRGPISFLRNEISATVPGLAKTLDFLRMIGIESSNVPKDEGNANIHEGLDIVLSLLFNETDRQTVSNPDFVNHESLALYLKNNVNQQRIDMIVERIVGDMGMLGEMVGSLLDRTDIGSLEVMGQVEEGLASVVGPEIKGLLAKCKYTDNDQAKSKDGTRTTSSMLDDDGAGFLKFFKDNNKDSVGLPDNYT
jgi:hypothetical protein